MQQCIELTVTNSPFGLTIKFYCGNGVVSARALQGAGVKQESVKQLGSCYELKIVASPSIFNLKESL